MQAHGQANTVLIATLAPVSCCACKTMPIMAIRRTMTTTTARVRRPPGVMSCLVTVRTGQRTNDRLRSHLAISSKRRQLGVGVSPGQIATRGAPDASGQSRGRQKQVCGPATFRAHALDAAVRSRKRAIGCAIVSAVWWRDKRRQKLLLLFVDPWQRQRGDELRRDPRGVGTVVCPLAKLTTTQWRH